MLLTSHLGRPKGKEDKYSLAPVADRLTELLGKKVTFVEDCIGDVVASAVSKMGEGEVALLENGAYLAFAFSIHPHHARGQWSVRYDGVGF